MAGSIVDEAPLRAAAIQLALLVAFASATLQRSCAPLETTNAPGLYDTELCTLPCQQELCRCLGKDDFNSINKSSFGDPASALMCVKRYRPPTNAPDETRCLVLQSCTARYLRCVEDFASAACKIDLRTSLMSVAAGDSYAASSAGRSCALTACSIYNVSGTEAPEYPGEEESFERRATEGQSEDQQQGCPVTDTALLCVDPRAVSGVLRLNSSQFEKCNGTSQLGAVASHLTAAIQNLVPTLNVTLHSLVRLSTRALEADFSVASTDQVTRQIVLDSLFRFASPEHSRKALAARPANSTAFLWVQVGVEYFGVRLPVASPYLGLETHLEESPVSPTRYSGALQNRCFSVHRAIPLVVLSGVPVSMRVAAGRNDSYLCRIKPFGDVSLWYTVRDNDLYSPASLVFRAVAGATTAIPGTQSTDVPILGFDVNATFFCPTGDRSGMFQFNLRWIVEVSCLATAGLSPILDRPPYVAIWNEAVDTATLSQILLIAWVAAAPVRWWFSAVNEEFLVLKDLSTLQQLANDRIDGFPQRSDRPPSCAGLANETASLNASAFASSTSVAVLGGNWWLDEGASAVQRCPTASLTYQMSVLRALVAGTDVFLASKVADSELFQSPDTRAVVMSAGGTTVGEWRAVLGRYDAYRAERIPLRCENAPRSTPPTMELEPFMDALVYWTGVCDVEACCVGPYCSTRLVAGGRGCHLPPLPDFSFATNGSLNVTVRSAAGAYKAIPTRVYMVPSTATFVVVAETPIIAKLAVNFRTLPTEEHCLQLVCLPNYTWIRSSGNSSDPIEASSIAELPSASTEVCITPADYLLQDPGGSRLVDYGSSVQVEYSSGACVANATLQRTAVYGDCLGYAVRARRKHVMLFPRFRPFAGPAETADDGAADLVTASGALVPVPLVPLARGDVAAMSSSEKETWCRSWAQASDPLSSGRAEAASCFQCPAVVDKGSLLPATFFPMPSFGGGVETTAAPAGVNCYLATGGTQPSAQYQWRRQCCYARDTGLLISGPPSRLESGDFFMWDDWEWPDASASTAERFLTLMGDWVPQTVCCAQDGATNLSCAMYNNARASGAGTTDLFRLAGAVEGCEQRGWDPPPPAAWGSGDPYCRTYDGVGFECNFDGEALWTACDDWEVHVEARPVGVENISRVATSIVAVAVSYRDALLTVERSVFNNSLVNIKLNRSTLFRDASAQTPLLYSGSQLTVSAAWIASSETADGPSYRIFIATKEAHVVNIDVYKGFLSVKTQPPRKCADRCLGLLGNMNGVASDDLRSRNGSRTLPLTANAEQIFTEVVQSYVLWYPSERLLTDSGWAPPGLGSTAGSELTQPVFLDALAFNPCPQFCDGDPSCCLDAAVLGSNFSRTTAASWAQIKSENRSVSISGYNWPPTIRAPTLVEALPGVDVIIPIAAYDADGVAAVGSDICQGSELASCSQELTAAPLAGNQTTKRMTIFVSSARLAIHGDGDVMLSVFAQDATGKGTTAFIRLSVTPAISLKPNQSKTSVGLYGTGQWGAPEVVLFRGSLISDLVDAMNSYVANERVQLILGTGVITLPSDITLTALSDEDVSNPFGSDPQLHCTLTLVVDGNSKEESTQRVAAISYADQLPLPRLSKLLQENQGPTASIFAASVTRATRPSSVACKPATCVVPVVVVLVAIAGLALGVVLLLSRSRRQAKKERTPRRATPQPAPAPLPRPGAEKQDARRGYERNPGTTAPDAIEFEV